MKNQSGRYKVSFLMTIISVFLFFWTAVSALLPIGTVEGHNLTVISMIKEIKSITKENGMAYMHLIVLNIFVIGSVLLMAATAVWSSICAIRDLNAKTCALESTAARMVYLTGTWFLVCFALQFYSGSYAYISGGVKEIPLGFIGVGFCSICVLLGFLVDLKRTPVKMFAGRFLSLIIFCFAFFGLYTMGNAIFSLKASLADTGALYSYEEGEQSMVTLTENAFGYIQQSYDAEKEAVEKLKSYSGQLDKQKQAGEEVDREKNDELNALIKEVKDREKMSETIWKYGLWIAVMAAAFMIMLLAYVMSMRNGAIGMCGNRFSITPQFVWSAFLLIFPWIFLFVYKKAVWGYTKYAGILECHVEFYLPMLCAVVFAAFGFIKFMLDKEALRMNMVMENIHAYAQGDGDNSVQHYQQMFGDKTLAEYEQSQGYQPYSEEEESNVTVNENVGTSYYQSDSTGTYEAGESLLGDLPRPEEKKISPKSRICRECGAENDEHADYCVICRKRLED